MRIRTVIVALGFVFTCGVDAVAAPAGSAPATSSSTSGAARVSVKLGAVPAVPQFTVKVPVHLTNVGSKWKRGAVECDYKAIQDITLPNVFNPTEPGSTSSMEMGHGTVAKAFSLSGSGNYNGTVSVGWSWSANEAGLTKYRQTYRCQLLVTESSSGDNNWYYASNAGIDVESGSAYRVVVEGEIK